MSTTQGPFTKYRADGWPLCPQCGEDELMSFYDMTEDIKKLSHIIDNPITAEQVKIEIRKDVKRWIDAGMRCYLCGWTLDKKKGG